MCKGRTKKARVRHLGEDQQKAGNPLYKVGEGKAGPRPTTGKGKVGNCLQIPNNQPKVCKARWG